MSVQNIPAATCRLAVAIIATGLLAPAALAADEGKLTLSAGVDFSSGDYGSNTDTEVWYLPLTAKYELGRSIFKLTMPYLRVSGPSGCVIIDGRPVCDASGAASSEEGLGDVVLGYSYSLMPKPVAGFFIDLGGKVKLGTADEDKGLGSGKNDYSAQADVYYLAGQFTPFATLGYRFMGDPAGYDFNDTWFGSLGLAYKLSNQNSVGALWDLRQKLTNDGEGANELMLYWSHNFAAGYKLQTYAVAGFSDASPDYGLGVMLQMSTQK